MNFLFLSFSSAITINHSSRCQLPAARRESNKCLSSARYKRRMKLLRLSTSFSSHHHRIYFLLIFHHSNADLAHQSRRLFNTACDSFISLFIISHHLIAIWKTVSVSLTYKNTSSLHVIFPLQTLPTDLPYGRNSAGWRWLVRSPDARQ